MKKKLFVFAAGLAVCALLTACATKQQPAQEETEQERVIREAEQAVAEADAYPETDFDALFNGLKPREGDEEEGIPEEYVLELKQAVEGGSYEEIVSYELAYPQTDDADFSQLNALFEEDLAYLKAQCAGSILSRASDRGCIAAVTGEYDYYIDQNLLYVDYDLVIRYSDAEAESYSTYSVQYDLASCTRLEG